MRVLVVHNRYRSDSPSGENEAVDGQVRALRQAGLEVQIYQRSSDEIAEFTACAKAGLAYRPFRSPADMRALRRSIRAWRPDIMHVHNVYPLLSPGVLDVAADAGIPIVHTVHNYRLWCPAGTCFRQGKTCQDCVGRRVAWPAVANACYRGSRLTSACLSGAMALNRRRWDGVARWIAPSEHIREWLTSTGVDPRKVRVVRYPAADLGPPDVLGEGFLFTSRLVPEKGCRLLLEAWQRSGTGRHSTLTIAGAGPESVLARAASGRDGVKYVGLVEPGTASELRKRSAVVVVPSLWNEPGSVAVTLALAAGRAVIATNVGGLPEAVDDAVGWCVPPTVSGLTAALEAASDRAQQRVKASRARSRYEALYSQRQTVRLLLATYEDLLRDSTGRRR